MGCPASKILCNHLVISTGVTFTNDTLVVNIPAGIYGNNQKYCIVVAQNIPDTTTINAPVVITIGTNTDTTYPVVNPNGTPVLASAINTRTRYTMFVRTGIESGVFMLANRLPCSQCGNRIPYLPAPATA